jgi:quercetin dioxygenase-like cupin family protein
MAKPLFDVTSTHEARLPDLIPVSQGGIVSKTLIEIGNFKQILFALDAEQELTDHRSPFVACIHLLDGRLHVRVEGTEYDLSANGWLLMPADAPHSLRALSPSRFVLTMVRPQT